MLCASGVGSAAKPRGHVPPGAKGGITFFFPLASEASLATVVIIKLMLKVGLSAA